MAQRCPALLFPRLAGQARGQGLLQIELAGEHSPYRLQQHRRRRSLGHVAAGTGIQRLAHQGQFVVEAEEQHTQLRQALAQPASQFQAADARQAEIDDDQRRNFPLHRLQGFFAVAGLVHLHVGEQPAQQRGQPFADHEMIVHQQDLHRPLLSVVAFQRHPQAQRQALSGTAAQAQFSAQAARAWRGLGDEAHRAVGDGL